MLANISSCQTRIPSSSQSSWNASCSYVPKPGSRTMFIPAARTVSRAVRSSARVAPRSTASSGVQSAPRAKTGTPLTWTNSPSRSISWSGRGPAAMVRKPTRPRSTVAAPPAPSPASSRTSLSAAAPWVCGHQRVTSGTRTSPAKIAAPSPPSASASVSGARVIVTSPRPAAPSTVTVTVPGRSAPSVRCSRRRTARTPRSPSTRVRSADSSTTSPRRRSSSTGRHGPAGAGPAANPGMRPMSVVRIQRRLLSATSRVRQRARGFRGVSRSGVIAAKRTTSSFRPRSNRPTSTTCSSNIERLARTCSPFSQASAIVARPPNLRTTSSLSAQAWDSKATRYHQSSPSGSPNGSPASRRAPAAVPGTRAGSQASVSIAAGSSIAPGVVAAACQPRSRRSRPDPTTDRPGAVAVMPSADCAVQRVDRLGPGGAQIVHGVGRIERPAAGQLEAENLAALDDPAHRGGGRRAGIAEQPVDVGREQLEPGTGHPERREGERVVAVDVALEERRQVGGEPGLEPVERVARHDPPEVATEELQRRPTELLAFEARSGVEPDQLRVRREDVAGPARLGPEGAPEVRARKLVQRGVVVVPEDLVREVDRLGDAAGLHVGVAIARRRGVRQIPGVQLDRHRPAEPELLLDLVGDRAVRLDLMDVQAVEDLHVDGQRLEERPLVVLHVHPDERSERRDRLVAAGMEELADDVGEAVRLDVRPLARVHEMRHVRGRIVPEQSDHRVRGRGHRKSSAPTSRGQLLTSMPWARKRARVIRSIPKATQPVWATAPPSNPRS